jgi:ribonucleotide reductase alpha subunit
VKSSSGFREERYVIQTNLEIGNTNWNIEMTLTNRDSMGFRMLLGREAMSGRVLVDPEQQYLLGQPTTDNLKEVYKTVWEMKSSNLIDMAADRGKFICQSQSMNLFMRDANVAKLNKALFYGWKKGLKTGMYYLRSNSKTQARQSLGVDDTIVNEIPKVEVTIPKINNISMSVEEIEAMNGLTCSLDNPDDCIACSG